MDKAKTIVVGDKVFRPAFDQNVTEEDWRRAEIELNETPEKRALALAVFRELINEQNEFIARTDDSYLLRFLRVRKFDVDKAYKLLEDHYKFRSKYPECFPSPSGVEKALRANIYNYLPHRDNKGRVIFVIKVANWNPDEVSFTDYIAAGNLMSEYILDNTLTQIAGFVGLWDTKGFTFNKLLHFCLPRNIYILTNMLQDRFPGRFKIAYIVNCSSGWTKLYNVAKAALKEKFRKRIKMLNNMSDLHQYLDPAILPEEYGGQQPPSDGSELAQKVLDSEAYFNYNRKFGF